MNKELNGVIVNNAPPFITVTDVLDAWLESGTILRYNPSAGKPTLNSIGHSRSYTYKFTALQFADKRVLPYPLAIRLAIDLHLDETKTAAFLAKIIHEKFIKLFYQNRDGNSRTSFYAATKDRAFLDFNIIAFIEQIIDESQTIIAHLIDSGFDVFGAKRIYQSIFKNPVKHLYDRIECHA